MKNRIIDLFCGCGGLSLGFEMAGFEVSYAIDMWEKAVSTYNHNHEKKVAECADIHSITDEQLIALNKDNDIVGVIGGLHVKALARLELAMLTIPGIICIWNTIEWLNWCSRSFL